MNDKYRFWTQPGHLAYRKSKANLLPDKWSRIRQIAQKENSSFFGDVTFHSTFL